MNDNAPLSFQKMHGLGNDFVVFDARTHAVALTSGQIEALANRRTGVGCDQVIVIGPSTGQTSDAFMSIFNADGSEVAACGNATRCVASILLAETGQSSVVIETKAGLLDAEVRDDGLIAVDMGPAMLDWREIPLSQAVNTLHLDLSAGALTDPVAVSMGNPHGVFFVDDADAIDLATLGPGLENHEMFPERANIGVAQIIGPDMIKLKVWERGAGLTLACGTGACAALVAASRRGLTSRKARVIQGGGELLIEWLPDGHVLMIGPVAKVFHGYLDTALL